VTRLLPLCLLHHSPQVRRVAASACRAVVGACPGLMGQLLAGLRHWANNTQEAGVLVVSGCWEGRGRGVQGLSAASCCCFESLFWDTGLQGSPCTA
jgi:hypothetical protein